MANPNPKHKFTKGNAFGRGGNAFQRITTKLRAQLFRYAKERGLEKAAKALFDQAESGDVASAALVLKYLIPEQPKEIKKKSTSRVKHDHRIVADPIARRLASDLERQLARNAAGNGESLN